MLAHNLLRLVTFAVALSFITTQAFAHCDLAYSASPSVAYKVVRNEVVERRTSIHAAESTLVRTHHQKVGGTAAAVTFDSMTSSQVRAAMPSDAVAPVTNDLNIRQRSLTYWLLYVRRQYESGQYSAALQTIAELRGKSILRDADADGGYDDGDVRIEAYFSVPSLTRLFHAYEQPSKLATLNNAGFDQDYRTSLKRTIETQSNTFNFENQPGANFELKPFLPVISAAALKPAAEFSRRRAAEKTWDRISKLSDYEEVLGVSDDIHNRIDMYIQANNVVGSLAIDEVSGDVTLLSGLSCQNDFEVSLSTLQSELPDSGKGVALSALVKANDRYVLTVSRRGHVYITQEELDRMMAGEAVAGKGAGEEEGAFDRVVRELIDTKQSLVLWSHPMMQKQGSGRAATMLFAHAIARAYPDLNVVIDDPNPKVPELAAKISELSISPKDIFVVIDRERSVKFQGELADEVAEVKKLIGPANVVFFDGTEPNLEPSTHERAVIVITGHADEALEKFIDHLAEKGYLKNSLVVLQSCGNELSPRLVSKINNQYGANGTFHYPEKILERDALAHTLDILKDVVVGNPVFGRLVRDRAAKPYKAWEKAMNGVWTICDAIGNELRWRAERWS